MRVCDAGTALAVAQCVMSNFPFSPQPCVGSLPFRSLSVGICDTARLAFQYGGGCERLSRECEGAISIQPCQPSRGIPSRDTLDAADERVVSGLDRGPAWARTAEV